MTDSSGGRRAKGINLIDHVKILRATRDATLLEELEPDERAFVTSHVLASSWYPYRLYARTLDLIYRRVSGSNPEVARDMGRLMGQRYLTGPHAMYVKRGDAEATLRGFTVIWKTFFDFARVSYAPDAAHTREGRIAWLGTIEDFPDIPKPLCLIVQGFLDKTLELCEAVDPLLEELSCAATGGHPACRYRTSWSAGAA